MTTFAHPGAAFRVELAKLRDQWLVRLALVVCVVAPAGFALIMRVQSTVPADTLFGRWARTSGFATSLTALGFAGSLALPLLAGIIAGDVFASEDRHGTWKTILTRSCTRADLFRAKSLAAAVWAVAVVVALAVSSLVSSLVLVSSAPLVGLSGQLVASGHATQLVLASWASVLPPTLAYVALGLFLSIVGRSGIVGVLGPALVGLAMQLLSLVASGEIVRATLIATPFDGWHGLLTVPAHVEPLVQGVATSAVYICVLLAASWYVLRRRAFAGAEAMPQRRRRLAVRASLMAAAVIAALTAASGWGSTEVTRHRLEAAVTPTFERLVSVQFLWRTHHRASASATVHVRSSCRRTSGQRAGPGDDWACVVRVIHPQVKGAALTLEVTVRANGCYTADAPAAIIGPPLLRDTRGRTFINPLASFDGCIGTV